MPEDPQKILLFLQPTPSLLQWEMDTNCYHQPLTEEQQTAVSKDVMAWFMDAYAEEVDAYNEKPSIHDPFVSHKNVLHRKTDELETVLRRSLFEPAYLDALNCCIHERYREQGYLVQFLLYPGQELDLRLTKAGQDISCHVAVPPSEPDQSWYDPFLSGLGPVSHLRLAGFSLYTDVADIARCAHEQGIDVLVDDDLTECFGQRFWQDWFDLREYRLPPEPDDSLGKSLFLDGMKRRKSQPWRLQYEPAVP